MNEIVQNRQMDFPVQCAVQDDDDIVVNRWLQRVQLFQAISKPVVKKLIAAGNYGLVTVKDKVDEDMGEEFDCLPLQLRFKALDWGSDPLVTSYDKVSVEFQRIKEDSVEANATCMWGPEYLIWLPRYKKFATFFFSNPTMHREHPNMKQLLGMRTTCKVKWIENKKNGWYGPMVIGCSTPFEFPTPEQVAEQDRLFLNPIPIAAPELADASTERAR